MINDLVFHLLRVGLGTEVTDFSADGIDDDVWKKVYRLGVRQGVGAVLLDGLLKLAESGAVGPESMPSRELKKRWVADCLRLESVCGMQYRLAAELAGIYASHGVHTVVLKGIAVGECYPVPFHRPCGDLDCFLPGEFEKGNQIAESVGAKVDRNFYKHSHIRYKSLEIENHQFCTAIRGSRRAKSFERLLQKLLREEGTTIIGDTSLGCPSPMFNALFLTHHSHRHYLSEGIALRHLCDWAMFLNAHGDKVDWQRFRSLAHEYGFVRFADSMTRLSERLLGVKAPENYGAMADDMADSVLSDDIMKYEKSHDYGRKWHTRVQIIKDLLGNAYRYTTFSDTTMLSNLVSLAIGFCFDRNPTL